MLQSKVDASEEKSQNFLDNIEATYSDEIRKVKEQEQVELREVAEVFSDSLYARTRALYGLIDRDGLHIFVYLIFSLFLVLELAPILAKMMQPTGVYEQLLLVEKENSEKLKDSYRYNSLQVNLDREVESYSSSVKAVVKKILDNSIRNIDTASHEERANEYFNHIYNNLLQTVKVADKSTVVPTYSSSSPPASPGYITLPMMMLILLTMLATIAPYIYFMNSYDIVSPDEAANTGLASGALTFSLLSAVLFFKKDHD